MRRSARPAPARRSSCRRTRAGRVADAEVDHRRAGRQTRSPHRRVRAREARASSRQTVVVRRKTGLWIASPGSCTPPAARRRPLRRRHHWPRSSTCAVRQSKSTDFLRSRARHRPPSCRLTSAMPGRGNGIERRAPAARGHAQAPPARRSAWFCSASWRRIRSPARRSGVGNAGRSSITPITTAAASTLAGFPPQRRVGGTSRRGRSRSASPRRSPRPRRARRRPPAHRGTRACRPRCSRSSLQLARRVEVMRRHAQAVARGLAGRAARSRAPARSARAAASARHRVAGRRRRGSRWAPRQVGVGQRQRAAAGDGAALMSARSATACCHNQPSSGETATLQLAPIVRPVASWWTGSFATPMNPRSSGGARRRSPGHARSLPMPCSAPPGNWRGRGAEHLAGTAVDRAVHAGDGVVHRQPRGLPQQHGAERIGIVDGRSAISTRAMQCASVEWPLGKELWGVWIIGCTCGESSTGRASATACLTRISTAMASRLAAPSSSSVRRWRSGAGRRRRPSRSSAAGSARGSRPTVGAQLGVIEHVLQLPAHAGRGLEAGRQVDEGCAPPFASAQPTSNPARPGRAEGEGLQQLDVEHGGAHPGLPVRERRSGIDFSARVPPSGGTQLGLARAADDAVAGWSRHRPRRAGCCRRRRSTPAPPALPPPAPLAPPAPPAPPAPLAPPAPRRCSRRSRVSACASDVPSAPEAPIPRYACRGQRFRPDPPVPKALLGERAV